jgi:hypothetical protein
MTGAIEAMFMPARLATVQQTIIHVRDTGPPNLYGKYRDFLARDSHYARADAFCEQ